MQTPSDHRFAVAPRSEPIEPTALVPRLIRIKQVRARTGLCRSEIYRRVRGGTFPAPVKLGPQTSAWSAEEVSQWIADRLSERSRRAA